MHSKRATAENERRHTMCRGKSDPKGPYPHGGFRCATTLLNSARRGLETALAHLEERPGNASAERRQAKWAAEVTRLEAAVREEERAKKAAALASAEPETTDFSATAQRIAELIKLPDGFDSNTASRVAEQLLEKGYADVEISVSTDPFGDAGGNLTVGGGGWSDKAPSDMGSVSEWAENVLQQSNLYYEELEMAAPEYDGYAHTNSYRGRIEWIDHPDYDNVLEAWDGRDSKGRIVYHEGYDHEGYDRLGRDKGGFDRNGTHYWTGTLFDGSGYDRYGRDHEGYDWRGRDKRGFDRGGLHRATGTPYNRDGLDRDGRTRDEYDRNGFEREHAA